MSDFEKNPQDQEGLKANKPIEESTATTEGTVVDDSAPVDPAVSESIEVAPTVVEDEPVQPARALNKSWPWMAVAAIAVVALVIVLVAGQKSNSMSEVVGTLNGAKITKADLYDEMVKNLGTQPGQILDNFMTVKLISSEANKAKVTVTDADISKQLQDLKTKNNITTDDQLNQALAQSNMTIDSLKENIKTQLEIQKILEPQIPVTDAVLQKYFEDNKASYGTPEQVKASHILLATQAEADAVLAELKKGVDFATLASQKSTDPGSKTKGGDLGYFGKGVMNPQFETAAFALKKGEMSGVVQSPNGFHIILVTDIKPAVVPTFESVKDQVKTNYIDSQVQTMAPAWMDKAKTDAHFTNLLVPTPTTTAPATSTAPAASAPAQK
jgi:foldase protein PrsA